MRLALTETFLAGVIGLFLGAIFLAGNLIFGFASSGIISPKPEFEDPFEKVQLKLEQKENDIKLSRNVTFVEEAGAAGDFNEASAYIVVDADSGEIIAEKDAESAHYIASITKIMTAVTVSDLVGLDEKFVISETAPKVEPTNMGLVPGQEWTLRELLHGMLMTSANDTAQAIKEGVDAKFGQNTFIRAMNEKAKFMGLKNSSFDNPQGYDGRNNYSSAQDLAVLSLYIYKNYPALAEIVQKEYQFFPESETHKEADLINWNGVLGVYPGVYGLKIGNTGKAGKTTVVAAQREGKKVLVVLLGASGILERDLWVSQLLDLGFEKKFNLKPINVKEEQLRAKYASWREI